MKSFFTVPKTLVLMLFIGAFQIVAAQTIVFSEDFESGTANAQWQTYYKNEDALVAKPMANAPKALTGGGNFVGLLRDSNVSFAGSAVAITGALSSKDYSIEADVYCYVNNAGGSAYTGLVVYADSSKKDFYKMRVDFDATDRINFSGLKSDPATFLPLFTKDFKGVDNKVVVGVDTSRLYPTVDGWHKLKIEIRNTSATQTSIWCYFNGTLVKNSPIVDTTSARVTSGSFGLYVFQNNLSLPGYYDNIVVKTLAPTSVSDNNNQIFPEGFGLGQNYPNPFNPETRISYQIASSGFVSLAIYDQLGREVATLVSQYQAAGQHFVNWNGKDESGNVVPSGTYFYSLKSGSNSQSKKMILMK
ncbi:MAG: FlgD immunoglobulin-like domain containing protein [Bacteroidota bacterium]|nr:FlgD immunoglobulin-like domain containing protein [Bacteroidota bacterium]